MTLNIDKFKETVKELENIVANQTQARTNKLKPFIEVLTETAANIEPLSMQVPANENLEPVPANEDLELELAAVKKDNKYLKRKQTMYDLKIEKMKQEIKDLKKIKGVKDEVKSDEEQIVWI